MSTDQQEIKEIGRTKEAALIPAYKTPVRAAGSPGFAGLTGVHERTQQPAVQPSETSFVLLDLLELSLTVDKRLSAEHNQSRAFSGFVRHLVCVE